MGERVFGDLAAQFQSFAAGGGVVDAAVDAALSDLFGAGLKGGEAAFGVLHVVAAGFKADAVFAKVILEDGGSGTADAGVTGDVLGMRRGAQEGLPGFVSDGGVVAVFIGALG